MKTRSTISPVKAAIAMLTQLSRTPWHIRSPEQKDKVLSLQKYIRTWAKGPKPNKYAKPHQGKQECERRLRQSRPRNQYARTYEQDGRYYVYDIPKATPRQQ